MKPEWAFATVLALILNCQRISCGHRCRCSVVRQMLSNMLTSFLKIYISMTVINDSHWWTVWPASLLATISEFHWMPFVFATESSNFAAAPNSSSLHAARVLARAHFVAPKLCPPAGFCWKRPCPNRTNDKTWQNPKWNWNRSAAIPWQCDMEWLRAEDQDAWLCIVLPVIDECRYCGLRDPCEHVR